MSPADSAAVADVKAKKRATLKVGAENGNININIVSHFHFTPYFSVTHH